jgi:hypothetical protein
MSLIMLLVMTRLCNYNCIISAHVSHRKCKELQCSLVNFVSASESLSFHEADGNELPWLEHNEFDLPQTVDALMLSYFQENIISGMPIHRRYVYC